MQCFRDVTERMRHALPTNVFFVREQVDLLGGSWARIEIFFGQALLTDEMGIKTYFVLIFAAVSSVPYVSAVSLAKAS